MDKPMTAERIAELEALCNAATPGPWIWESSRGDRVRLWTKPSGDFVVEIGRKPGGWTYFDMTEDDAGFIAHARTALPELLAQVRRLRAMIKPREWDSDGFCQWCYALRTNGHIADCPWQLALAGDA